jgi:transposase
MRTVALDLGKRSIDWCEVKDGRVVGRGRVRGLEALVATIGPGMPKAVVGFEACRESRHVHDVIASWGHEPRVFDTTRVRRCVGIGEHGKKNDRIDSERLARALERDHAAMAHVLGDDARELRELQEMHRALVYARKRAVTHIRGILRGRGVDVASCAIEDFVRNVRKASLPEPLQALVEPLLRQLDVIDPELAVVDLRLQEVCMRQRDPVIERLASTPGVSLLVAAAFISTIDEPTRFKNASQVASYLGLCPAEESTGGRRKLGEITKQGNAYARSLLVQAAWCVLRSRDTKDPLVHWAHRTALRRGRMRAAVAVARRLARILWALWRHGVYYDPHEHGREHALSEAAQASKLEQMTQARKRGELKLARQRRANQRILLSRTTGAEAQLTR